MTDASKQMSVLLGLVSLFIASIVTAQVLGSKLVPLGWNNVMYPAGVVAYSATFFATDTLAEMYGKEKAHSVVNWGFGMNFVFLALIWGAISLPNQNIGVNQDVFVATLAPATNIVVAGLIAYLVSQHWDVFVFHKVRDATGKSRLWLRNLASTTTSQLLDTIVFTSIAFILMPQVFGLGHYLGLELVGYTIIGQYALKLLIAAIDTPLVYAAVYGLENFAGIDRDDVHGSEVVA